ncbi:MAG TPA: response regulator [Candidatus Latescibacteria bacterium]|nr:response regulator [Candidatus Latescibacterota bacterium]
MENRPIVILLIEDNPDHVELILRALEEEHTAVDVYVVKDGQEALDYMYRRGKYGQENERSTPRLVLLDLRLPKLDGFEVLRRLKTDPKFKPIPVVILTTSLREDEVMKGYAEGANSYVTKPVEFDDFIQKVKDITRYWTLTNTLPV